MQPLASSAQAARQQLTHSSMRSGMRDNPLHHHAGLLPAWGAGRVKQVHYERVSTLGQVGVTQLDNCTGSGPNGEKPLGPTSNRRRVTTELAVDEQYSGGGLRPFRCVRLLTLARRST